MRSIPYFYWHYKDNIQIHFHSKNKVNCQGVPCGEIKVILIAGAFRVAKQGARVLRLLHNGMEVMGRGAQVAHLLVRAMDTKGAVEPIKII